MKKVLVIEDDLAIRENTIEILELNNYQPFSATNGWEGIVAAKTHIPDLILCDILMPELDGYGVIKVLKGDPITARIPFIFLSASVEKNEIQFGLDLGADLYLKKPFAIEELMESIERLLT
jgi:CheY-like chemotaxis protein